MLLTKNLLVSPSNFVIKYTKRNWRNHLRLTPHIPTVTPIAHYKRLVYYNSPVDERVEKVKEDIKYSEYFENLMIKLPYVKLMESQRNLRHTKSEENLKSQIDRPSISVALKCLQAAQVVNTEDKSSSGESDNYEFGSKPIYMPYSAKDKVEIVPIVQDAGDADKNKEEAGDEEEREIHKGYKQEYEEFLKHDKEFNQSTQWRDDVSAIPPNWMSDYEVVDMTKLQDTNQDPWGMKYGTPDPNARITGIPCGGCGALLHCKDPQIPGYIPSELFIVDDINAMNTFICQRCHFMKYYNVALDVKVSAEEYPELLSKIKSDQVRVVVLIVDLTDFPGSIWPNIHDIIGHKARIFLVGNKVDLLPQDSTDFFTNVKEELKHAAIKSGVREDRITGVALISAKTMFGIEELINKLFLIKRPGHVYLIGCTNVGKSSLFNALLSSDYCNINAVDLVQRATVAPWPGTTLNLLKFPIARGYGVHLSARAQRLMHERFDRQMEAEEYRLKYRETRDIRHATLQGRLTRTFDKKYAKGVMNSKIQDIFNLNANENKVIDAKNKYGLDFNRALFRNSKWCYDTPGTVHPDQILHLLTTEELMKTLSKQIIMPRSFVLNRNETLFLAGLGRIDLLECNDRLRVTVFASSELPVTICATEKADYLYKELLRTPAFAVPVPDEERLKVWPEMKSEDLTMIGVHFNISAADVILSSAGWVAITPAKGDRCCVRAWTPEGRGIFLRQPALLKNTVKLRGARVQQTPAYRKTKIVFGTH